MANDKTANYRIGLLGCGGITGAWIEAVEEHAQCRIVLAYDLAREAAERRAQEAGAQVAATVEELLEAIETGGEPENGPLNGKKNIALGLGMYWSFETGRRIDYKAGIPVDMADDYQNVHYY